MTDSTSELTFVTGNNQKFIPAQQSCKLYGINLVQASPEIVEIQSENGEQIARHKAKTAYEILKTPVVVTDDSWHISGLRGFPGAYMKSMNHWLTTADFLRLTRDLEDRTVILEQYLVFQDEGAQMLVTRKVTGTILKEVRGIGDCPWVRLATMEGDAGKTIAEIYDNPSDKRSTRLTAQIWHDFAKKYREELA